MSKRFIYGADGSVIREMVVHDEETFTTVAHHNVDPFLDYAKHRRDEGSNRKAKYREIAYIPPHVQEQAFRQGWAHDDDQWRKWYNDSQNRCFHTDDSIKRI